MEKEPHETAAKTLDTQFRLNIHEVDDDEDIVADVRWLRRKSGNVEGLRYTTPVKVRGPIQVGKLKKASEHDGLSYRMSKRFIHKAVLVFTNIINAMLKLM